MSLVFEDASCRFTPARSPSEAALDCFTLRAAPGEVTCLVGPNGAGKSTALAAAAGLLRLASGSIRYRDRPVAPTSPVPLLGYLPQKSSFPRALCVGEVLDFSFAVRETPEPTRREVRALMGLEDKLDQVVGTLSTGWVRRLGLAVALVPPFDLLMLDEPFVGLDLELLDAIVPHLESRAAEDGATVVLASHDFDVIDALRARVVVMREGRHVAESSGAPPGGSREYYRRSLGRVPDDSSERSEDHVVHA